MEQSTEFAVYPSLRERTVLITGGASGIGAVMVEQFMLQGSRVAFLDVAVDAATALVEKLGGLGPHAPLFVRCDLTDISALRAAVAEVEARLGAVRVLVNNAASDDRHSFAEVTPEYWDERMAVNLRHQFFATQAVAKHMTDAGGGSVINMGSISWVIPATDLPAYTTAKAAVVGLTRTLAHTLGGSNIRGQLRHAGRDHDGTTAAAVVHAGTDGEIPGPASVETAPGAGRCGAAGAVSGC